MSVERPNPERRRLLLAAPAWFALIASGGCKSAEPAACNQTRDLGDEDVRARTTLAYADRGGDPKRHCIVCSQYVEPTEKGGCGGCKVLKGPIHPRGTCNVFTPKA